MDTDIRILTTGAGGPAAIAFMRSLPSHNFFAADMDPYAAGLYLVPERQRFLIPAADDSGFVDHLLHICVSHEIDVLVPTVDAELLPIARRLEEFRSLGIECLLAPQSALEVCLDKWNLALAMGRASFMPETRLITESLDFSSLEYPLVAKPRSGSGSRGVRMIRSAADLRSVAADGTMILQEFLPGPEYSVDVVVPAERRAVPVVRERLKVDSGVAVTSRIRRDQMIEHLAEEIVARLGLTFVSNVQFRRGREGRPKLLEINPRFPGTMALTVAGGINMPQIALKTLFGQHVSADELRFEETAIVRTWQEHVVRCEEISTLEEEQAFSQNHAAFAA